MKTRFTAKSKGGYKDGFSAPAHTTNYNKRRNRLAEWTGQDNCKIAAIWNEGGDVYIWPAVPRLRYVNWQGGQQLKACRHRFETAPGKGYSAVHKQYYIGYKPHLAIGVNGVCQGMGVAKASVHGVHYLNGAKYGGTGSCTLLGGKGYLSTEWQLGLFVSAGIKLGTRKRANQKGYRPWPFVFKPTRKRIEVVFVRLCDQMMPKRNYANTFEGLKTRVMAKVAAVTVLQYINHLNGKPLNHIKHALAA